MTTRKIFTEEVHEVDLDQISDHTNHSQHSGYWGLHRRLRPHIEAAQESGNRNTLISCLQELLQYPDHCTQESTLTNPQGGRKILLDTPILSTEKIYPKEQSLVELVTNEKNEGRRVLIYMAHTVENHKNITTRLRTILAENGHQAETLQQLTARPLLRKKWMKEKVKQGVDALIFHPRLVPTGMDLADFPTVVWFEPKYSVFTLKQASIRSWRNDQKTLPVRVIHYVYAKTLQQEALRLMDQMMKNSEEGEQNLTREILAAYTRSEDC